MEIIWAAYPADGSRDRASCRRHLAGALAEVTLDELSAATKAYAAGSAGFTRAKVRFLDNWLRDGKWRRHVEDLRVKDIEKECAAANRLVQVTDWIKTRHGMCQHLTAMQVREVLAKGLVGTLDAAWAGCGRDGSRV